MMSKIQSLLFTGVVLAFVSKTSDAVTTVNCYSCFYDNDYPNLPLADPDCKGSNIDQNNVKTEIGRSCFSALYERDGNLVSVWRGGNANGFQEFTLKVHKKQEDYTVSYCDTDYCNGATPVRGAIALITIIAIFAGWNSSSL